MDETLRPDRAALSRQPEPQEPTEPTAVPDAAATWERMAFSQGARRESLEFAIALADDRLNKRGDPIAAHIYLVNALHGEPLSDALQDEARALLEDMGL